MDWREAEAEFSHPVVGDSTLGVMFEKSADRNADATAQRYKGGAYDRSLAAAGVVPPAPDGDFGWLTYHEMRDVVRTLAAGFRALGVDPGDRVGVLAHTRMEWAQVDFALLAAGGAVTTIYSSSSEVRVRHLLSDSESVGVVVENADLLRRVLAVEDDLDPGLDFVVVMDEVPDGSGAAGAVRDRDDLLTLGDLYRRGAAAFDADAYAARLAARDPGDVASIIYTSGTTGPPKGVRLTHRNFRSNVNQTYRRFGPRPDRDADLPAVDTDTTTLSYLPLAHVFERLAGHFMMFAAGATVAYAESPDTLREDFGLVRPTSATSVPRVYEKLYAAVREEANQSAVSRRAFEWAVEIGRAHHAADDPGPALSLKRSVADRLVFSKVRDALGGEIDFFISGGGSLSADLCALYHAMGLPILEGYGLTETSPVVAANPPEAPKVGTVGPPVPDLDVALDASLDGVAPESGGEVGELLVRGPNVADGYWHDADATDAAFTRDLPDGATLAVSGTDANGAGGRWFRTGDVVELRPDGYLTVRERVKQLIVLSTGKNVAPGPLEDAFAASSVVEQVLVLGDGRRYVSALVVPDFDALRAWAAGEGVDLPASRREVCRHDAVRARIREEVDRVNERFEDYETIKRFRLVPEAFTQEDDLVTPTMKKKRRNILDRYADQVEMLYDDA